MATLSTVATSAHGIGAMRGVAATTLARGVFWSMLAAKLLGAWGLRWDIQWHLQIGRDSFWIAPHVMTYSGVGLVVLLSFGLLAVETARHRSGPVPPPMMRMLGLVGTRGAHLAAWGIALTVLAAPIDDLWHRLFGIDVTLWSPPHLLGLAGAAVNSLGCVVLAREVYPTGRRAAFAGVVIGAAMFYGTLRIVLIPAFDLAYRHGGIAFHAHAILGALLLPVALVSAARITGARGAPLAIAVVSALIGLSGDAVAHVGFAALQPVSVIDEVIAQDPGSPIAVANAVARKNGERPGTMSMVPLLASLIAVSTLVAVDARRRPRAATLAFAVADFAVFGWLLAHSPAFGPNAPGAGATLAAMGLTVIAALGGAAGGTRLARILNMGASRHTGAPAARRTPKPPRALR
ncbi:MAG TPA: hypothetical protein VGQ77_03210 [Methylomirabilota bacterium]|nr:hypothetical protein [Methylomirabilota bacterium]